jgi:hypothetical protein
MPTIVFLPGILGSRLFLGDEEVWPPTLAEAVFGYGRGDRLADPAVRAGAPIGSVLCLDVYARLLADLAEIAGGRAGAPPGALHAIGWDWRGDLLDTVDEIAARLDELPAAERREIVFVGHSMGGLLVDLLLDAERFADRAWFAAITGAVGVAVPRRGTPTALLRVLGLEGGCGLSGAATRRLAADPRHPALHQLLPAPGTATLWEATGGGVEPLDLFAPAVARRLGLEPHSLDRARALHRRLAMARPPAGLARLDLVGDGAETCLGVDLVGDTVTPRRGPGGDGSVPAWSALDPTRPHHVVAAPHEAVFRHPQARALLHRGLGARLPARPFAAEAPSPTLLAARPVFAAGRPIDLLLATDRPVRRLDGEVVIATATAEADRLGSVVARCAVTLVESDRLALRLPPIDRPGPYAAAFVDERGSDQADVARFVVAALDRGRPA